MPVNRQLFFIFFIVLVGSLLYLKFGPATHDTETVTLTPKQYIERVQQGRQAPDSPERQ